MSVLNTPHKIQARNIAYRHKIMNRNRRQHEKLCVNVAKLRRALAVEATRPTEPHRLLRHL